MPQMSPIMWNYFIFFVLIVIFISLIYLSFELIIKVDSNMNFKKNVVYEYWW